MACAEIRDKNRTTLDETRQLNRDKVLGTKRKALQDVVNIGRYVTEEEVVLVGNKLKSKSAVQIEDLAILKLAFVQSARNTVAFLKVKGALHSLVRELSSGKSNFQLVASECCCNLALGDPRSCLQVAKAAGPYLIAFLSGCNYNLTNVSVWALGNLMGSDDKTWNVVHSQGFLGKLLQLLQEHDNNSDMPSEVELQQSAMTTLVQLLRIGFKLLKPEEVESIARTVVNLKNTSGKGLRVCEYLLSCMEAAERELLENKLHLRCLQYLENTELTDDNIALFTPAVRTIANLVAEASGVCCLDIFAKWNILQDLVQRIFASPYTHLVGELGWLFGNLMNHPSPEVQSSVLEHSFDFQLFISQFAFFKA